MIYKLIMLSEKQQIWRIWLSAKNLTHSKSMGILDYIKYRYSKNGFLETNWNLACRVILSIYTLYVIFKQIWAWHCSRPSYLKTWNKSTLLEYTVLCPKEKGTCGINHICIDQAQWTDKGINIIWIVKIKQMNKMPKVKELKILLVWSHVHVISVQ